MAENRTSQITALRRSIDCLPRQTRLAMLTGIDNNTIVVGAYTHDDGVCPMLAAHRNGGRTNFVAFARAWDEFCFRGVRMRRRKPRLATATELATLRAHIEGSLLAEDENVDLRRAMTEHHRLVAAREERQRTSLLARRPRADRATVAPDPATVEPVAPVAPPAPGTPSRVRPGDPDRSRELSRRGGGNWLRVVRSYDEYAAALAEVEARELERAIAEREAARAAGRSAEDAPSPVRA